MKASIVAPVKRFLGVQDAERSAAFYRDVLGFEVRDSGTEAVRGPAAIEFDSSGPARSVVFFETSDVEAMRSEIAARGGNPGEFVKVNRVKMRVFEVRDPDGHALWFGQSYDVPVDPRPRGLIRKALPRFPVSDVAAAVAYYRDVLGFKINYQQQDLGVMDRDEVTVLLNPRDAKHLGIGSSYFYVANADALYAELKAKGAKIDGEPVSHPWGLRDFGVIDPDGNELWFGQPFE
jgi:catechol 2,3-dioxygenase-like lactoylglutathione lyase family enzyme